MHALSGGGSAAGDWAAPLGSDCQGCPFKVLTAGETSRLSLGEVMLSVSWQSAVGGPLGAPQAPALELALQLLSAFFNVFSSYFSGQNISISLSTEVKPPRIGSRRGVGLSLDENLQFATIQVCESSVVNVPN